MSTKINMGEKPKRLHIGLTGSILIALGLGLLCGVIFHYLVPAGTVRDDGNPDFAQLGDRAMMRRVAKLLGRGRSGIDDKLRLAPGAPHQLGKHRLSHRRATDVAMADKKNALHRVSFLDRAVRPAVAL